MTRKSGKRVSQGKGYALSHPRSGELTCSEWQVDDVLSAGESTQEERSLPEELIHPEAEHPIRHEIIRGG
jgi:hypothetical protein